MNGFLAIGGMGLGSGLVSFGLGAENDAAPVAPVTGPIDTAVTCAPSVTVAVGVSVGVEALIRITRGTDVPVS